jgi:hypothetical protein
MLKCGLELTIATNSDLLNKNKSLRHVKDKEKYPIDFESIITAIWGKPKWKIL